MSRYRRRASAASGLPRAQSSSGMLAPAPLLGGDPVADEEWSRLRLKWGKKWKWWTVVLVEQRLHDAFGQFGRVPWEADKETEDGVETGDDVETSPQEQQRSQPVEGDAGDGAEGESDQDQDKGGDEAPPDAEDAQESSDSKMPPTAAADSDAPPISDTTSAAPQRQRRRRWRPKRSVSLFGTVMQVYRTIPADDGSTRPLYHFMGEEEHAARVEAEKAREEMMARARAIKAERDRERERKALLDEGIDPDAQNDDSDESDHGAGGGGGGASDNDSWSDDEPVSAAQAEAEAKARAAAAAERLNRKAVRRASVSMEFHGDHDETLLDELKVQYNAADAAEGNEFYTPAAMMRRASIQWDRLVQLALSQIWRAFDSDQSSTMDMDEYIVMHRKMWRAVFDGDESGWSKDLAVKEWHQDRDGYGHLNFKRFSKCWLTLADRFTDEIAAQSTTDFLVGMCVKMGYELDLPPELKESVERWHAAQAEKERQRLLAEEEEKEREREEARRQKAEAAAARQEKKKARRSSAVPGGGRRTSLSGSRRESRVKIPVVGKQSQVKLSGGAGAPRATIVKERRDSNRSNRFSAAERRRSKHHTSISGQRTPAQRRPSSLRNRGKSPADAAHTILPIPIASHTPQSAAARTIDALKPGHLDARSPSPVNARPASATGSEKSINDVIAGVVERHITPKASRPRSPPRMGHSTPHPIQLQAAKARETLEHALEHALEGGADGAEVLDLLTACKTELANSGKEISAALRERVAVLLKSEQCNDEASQMALAEIAKLNEISDDVLRQASDHARRKVILGQKELAASDAVNQALQGGSEDAVLTPLLAECQAQLANGVQCFSEDMQARIAAALSVADPSQKELHNALAKCAEFAECGEIVAGLEVALAPVLNNGEVMASTLQRQQDVARGAVSDAMVSATENQSLHNLLTECSSALSESQPTIDDNLRTYIEVVLREDNLNNDRAKFALEECAVTAQMADTTAAIIPRPAVIVDVGAESAAEYSVGTSTQLGGINDGGKSPDLAGKATAFAEVAPQESTGASFANCSDSSFAGAQDPTSSVAGAQDPASGGGDLGEKMYGGETSPVMQRIHSDAHAPAAEGGASAGNVSHVAGDIQASAAERRMLVSGGGVQSSDPLTEQTDVSLSTAESVSQARSAQKPLALSESENFPATATIPDAEISSRLKSDTHDQVHSQKVDSDKLETEKRQELQMERRQQLLTERDSVRSALAHVRAAKSRTTAQQDSNSRDVRRKSMSKQLREYGAAWHEDAEVLAHICDAELAALPPSAFVEAADRPQVQSPLAQSVALQSGRRTPCSSPARSPSRSPSPSHSEGWAQDPMTSPRASPTSSIDGSDRPEGTLFPQSPSTEGRLTSQRHRRRKRLPQASPSPLASPSSAAIVHMRNGGTFEAFRSPGGDETLSSTGHVTFDALCRRGGWYLRNQCPELTHNLGTRLLRGVEAGCPERTTLPPPNFASPTKTVRPRIAPHSASASASSADRQQRKRRQQHALLSQTQPLPALALTTGAHGRAKAKMAATDGMALPTPSAKDLLNAKVKNMLR